MDGLIVDSVYCFVALCRVTINLRYEGLHAERTEHAFEHAAHGAEPDDVVMARQQKVLRCKG